MRWSNPFTFAYDSTGAIIYAIMGSVAPSWWPTNLNVITLDDNSTIPGHKLFKNQRGKPLANIASPMLTPYFDIVTQPASSANTYIITATLEDPPISPPTACIFNVNGTTTNVNLVNNTASYTVTVATPTQETNITVSASGVADGYATIAPLNPNTFSGSVDTILLQTTGVEVNQVVAPGAPTLTVATSGNVGPNLVANTKYTYGFTAIDAQGFETNLAATSSVTLGTTAYPITIAASTVANAQSYWLYRNNVRLIQLTSPNYTDNGNQIPGSQNPPSSNNTGVANANLLYAGTNDQFSVDGSGNVATTGGLWIARETANGSTRTITLAIGDSDTGFQWVSDGHLQMYANDVAQMDITNGQITIYPSVNLATNSNTRVGIGTTNPAYQLDVVGDIQASGTIHIRGISPILFQDYGGGFYMTDNTWIRTYGSRSFYHNTGEFRTDGTLEVGAFGGTLRVDNRGSFNYNGGTLFANISGSVGVGTSSPAAPFHVVGATRIDNGNLTVTTSNAGIELGSESTPNTPYVDFHSSGYGNDYDARIIASNGANSINGSGTLTVEAQYLKMGTTRFILPVGKNLY